MKVKDFKTYTDPRSIAENLFYTLFNGIPSVKRFDSLEREKIEKYFKDNIKESKFETITWNEVYKSYNWQMIHRVKDSDIFLSYSSEGKTTDVTVYYGVNTSIEKYENDLIAMKAPTKSRIGLLVQDMNGISVYNTDADLVKVDLKLNYGDDFIEKDKRIKEYLRGDKSGLILLHSVPGAGKSTYIQHLCNCVDKRFIFIPSNMAFNLASPSFIRILIDNKDCVLVIEDAEKIIKSRESREGSEVADLLNISDGILGNLLKTKIVATYNTKRENVDEALLRKGRLLCEHEFKKLNISNAKKLAKKLHGDNAVKLVDRDMTLAEIYHLNMEGFKKKNSPIGFELEKI